MIERYLVCPHRNDPAAFEHFFVRKGLWARALAALGRGLMGAGRAAHELLAQPLRA